MAISERFRKKSLNKKDHEGYKIWTNILRGIAVTGLTVIGFFKSDKAKGVLKAVMSALKR